MVNLLREIFARPVDAGGVLADLVAAPEGDGDTAPPAANEAGPLTLNADERAALAPEERALWTGLWQERQRLLVRARGLPADEAGALLAEADGLRARAAGLRQAARERVAGGQP